HYIACVNKVRLPIRRLIEGMFSLGSALIKRQRNFRHHARIGRARVCPRTGASCRYQQGWNAAFTRQGRRKLGERATFSTSTVLPRKRGVPTATSFLQRGGTGNMRPPPTTDSVAA